MYDEITVKITVNAPGCPEDSTLCVTIAETVIANPTLDDQGFVALNQSTLDRLVDEAAGKFREQLQDMARVRRTLINSGDLPGPPA